MSCLQNNPRFYKNFFTTSHQLENSLSKQGGYFAKLCYNNYMNNKQYYRFTEKQLMDWYTNPHRKPIILLGARQVGKTTLVQKWAKAHIKQSTQFFYFNLEKLETFQQFSKASTVKEILQLIEIQHKTRITPNSLIFFDEVQHNPHLIKLLRFFKEDYPEIAVIVSGSWLNIYLTQLSKQKDFSFPVGRVEFMTLFPFSFLEYLYNKNQIAYQQLIDEHFAISPALHDYYLQEFTNYMLLGGMPDVLKSCALQPCAEAEKIHTSILNTIMHDIGKYLNTNKEITIDVFNMLYQYPARALSYSKILPNTNQYTIKKILNSLHNAFLITPIKRTYSTQLPLTPAPKNATKYLSLDTGLSLSFNQIFAQLLKLLHTPETFFDLLESTHKGFLMEQITGQLLLPTFYPSYLPYINTVHYWQNKDGKAEIDFVIPYNQYLLGLEVKSGKVGKLRSLFEFLNKVNNAVGVRVYAGTPRIEKTQLTNKTIISIPFYLIELLPQIIDSLDLE